MTDATRSALSARSTPATYARRSGDGSERLAGSFSGLHFVLTIGRSFQWQQAPSRRAQASGSSPGCNTPAGISHIVPPPA